MWTFGHQVPHFCIGCGCYHTSGNIWLIWMNFIEFQLPMARSSPATVSWEDWQAGAEESFHQHCGEEAQMPYLGGRCNGLDICLWVVLRHAAPLPSTHWLSSSQLAGKSSISLLWPYNTVRAPPRALKQYESPRKSCFADKLYCCTLLVLPAGLINGSPS